MKIIVLLIAPVEETPTIYEAFNVEEEKKERKLEKEQAKLVANASRKLPTTKKPADKKKDKPPTIEQIVATVYPEYY